MLDSMVHFLVCNLRWKATVTSKTLVCTEPNRSRGEKRVVVHAVLVRREQVYVMCWLECSATRRPRTI